LVDRFENGKLTRREFLRYAALLGISMSAASSLIGLTRLQPTLATTIKRGGILKIAAAVHKVTHPAQLSWGAPANY